ncbi:MAG: nucleotide sugar dehydrogenase [Fibrobacteres bacterium]|jgi:UDP-N-acetyl-D-galactosamine dehydrogenase|nr:nucleotide sugar dehydrogenase [Fibrobacterota bacterium]
MSKNRQIAVVGLGYVGMPIAVYFGRVQRVIAFDINPQRIDELKRNIDRNHDVNSEEIAKSTVDWTLDAARIKEADFVIVTVPTPVDTANRPDLTPLKKASLTVGRNLKKGAIVVYESTVYPGATEEDCVPVLEKESGMKCGVDFKVGYSPERINPGDHEHTFTRITKVVSGMDAETLDIVAETYSQVVTAGVFKASSIKVAEAAKVIENTQRDLNISLVNELSVIFHRLGIDTSDVLAAAGTKWNFLKFQPGLVGGHCIGVDPYYLTHKAEQVGYIPQVILAGRRINDSMGRFIAREMTKELLKLGNVSFDGNRPVITVLGLTFKENVSDIRNTKVVDIIAELRSFGFEVQVTDPMAYPEEAKHEYGEDPIPLDKLKPAVAVVLAVAHDQFKKEGWALPQRLLRGGKGVVADIKNLLPRDKIPAGITLWRL